MGAARTARGRAGTAAALELLLAAGGSRARDAVGLIVIAAVVRLRGGGLVFALPLACWEEEAAALGTESGGGSGVVVGGVNGGYGGTGGGARGGDGIEAVLDVVSDLLVEGDGDGADEAHAVNAQLGDERRVGHVDGLQLVVVDVRAEGEVEARDGEDGDVACLDARLDMGVAENEVLDSVCIGICVM